jgi:nucleoid-associated protein YgaU
LAQAQEAARQAQEAARQAQEAARQAQEAAQKVQAQEEARLAREAARAAEAAALEQAQAEEAARAAEARTMYTVQKGDSLWSIAANPRVYNDPYLWTLLYNANREKLENPDNPNLIEPGMVLTIPNSQREE